MAPERLADIEEMNRLHRAEGYPVEIREELCAEVLRLQQEVQKLQALSEAQQAVLRGASKWINLIEGDSYPPASAICDAYKDLRDAQRELERLEKQATLALPDAEKIAQSILREYEQALAAFGEKEAQCLK